MLLILQCSNLHFFQAHVPNALLCCEPKAGSAASGRQQELTLSTGHRWSQWHHSATRGSVSRRVVVVCTGTPKLWESRLTMKTHPVLSASDTSRLTTSRWRYAADSRRVSD